MLWIGSLLPIVLPIFFQHGFCSCNGIFSVTSLRYVLNVFCFKLKNTLISRLSECWVDAECIQCNCNISQQQIVDPLQIWAPNHILLLGCTCYFYSLSEQSKMCMQESSTENRTKWETSGFCVEKSDFR